MHPTVDEIYSSDVNVATTKCRSLDIDIADLTQILAEFFTVGPVFDGNASHAPGETLLLPRGY